ncbi:MAG: anaphase-promoting complex subunit cdc27 [Ramalina farinacea]|uniref:Anaphase-promoting complex subunit cdc27 n=1 Tax=Ramalina farinacea TaxID=258253 RepID=A0AA43TYD7_9LECA|nr:anaphase-promoting complex subunit cdc27 [Ramalina farinacea]
MAPGNNPHVVSQLRQLIYYHLDCNLTRNALFFAGRLTAYEPRSSEAAYLLSLCYLKLGQLSAALKRDSPGLLLYLCTGMFGAGEIPGRRSSAGKEQGTMGGQKWLG